MSTDKNSARYSNRGKLLTPTSEPVPLTEREFQEALENSQDWNSKEWIRLLPPDVVRDLLLTDKK
jgi:hypothetical protein